MAKITIDDLETGQEVYADDLRRTLLARGFVLNKRSGFFDIYSHEQHRQADSSLNRNIYTVTVIGGCDGREVQSVERLGTDKDHGDEGGGSQCARNFAHTAPKCEYHQPGVAA